MTHIYRITVLRCNASNVAAFTVPSKHYVLALHTDRDRCKDADPKDIAIGWLYHIGHPQLIKKYEVDHMTSVPPSPERKNYVPDRRIRHQ